MNAENWLNQIKKLEQLIGMPFSNTGMVPQKMQDAVIDLIELAQEIDKLVARYIKKKQEIVAVLEKLPEKEYGVLHRHYIRCMTWEQVAEDMDYSTMQIWRIRKNGMKILENIL